MPARPEKVYYFGTCLIDLCYPQAGMAGIELLRREAFRSFIPSNNPAAANPLTIPASAKKPARSPASNSGRFPRITRSSFHPAPAAEC